ncbi:MAG: hypothetical protein LBE25_13335 [Arthrobacter sp.]|jgi:hypothetical protein|nr:hypothetical protein [Arthrobacter sp.]
MLKKILRGAGTLALAGGLVASGAALAAPAQAAVAAPAALTAPAAGPIATPIRVSKVTTTADYYKGRLITVSSKGCKSNTIAISGDVANGVVGAEYQFSADIYRGSKRVKTVTFKKGTSSYTQAFCPKVSAARYGSFQIKNVRVKGRYQVSNGSIHSFNYAVGKNSKTFYYKGAIDGSLYGKKAAGSSKRTFTAKLTYFSDKHQKWVKYNPSGAKLQVKSGGKWKTVKSLKFKSGKASYSLRTSSKKSYRLYVPAKSYAIGGTTRSFTI